MTLLTIARDVADPATIGTLQSLQVKMPPIEIERRVDI